jgi:hypothetical protein
VDTGFPKRSCSNKGIERDDDSKKSHRALDGNVRRVPHLRQIHERVEAKACPQAENIITDI